MAFRLKMFDFNTWPTSDKGWLGVSEGNNVQLFYGNDGKSNAAICEWIDDEHNPNHPTPVWLKLRDYNRALGVGTNNSAEWGLWSSGGWKNKVWNLKVPNTDKYLIVLPSDGGGWPYDDGNGLVPNSDGWSVNWGQYDRLGFIQYDV